MKIQLLAVILFTFTIVVSSCGKKEEETSASAAAPTPVPAPPQPQPPAQNQTNPPPAPIPPASTNPGQPYDMYTMPIVGGWYAYSDYGVNPPCTTGIQEFKTLGEYCDKIKSEDLNKNCAKINRSYDFLRNCPGRSWN